MPNTSETAPVAVTVTLLSDGEYRVDAPPGVSVTVHHELADDDRLCSCGHVLRQDESGGWFHVDAPELWGDDHPANPQ